MHLKSLTVRGFKSFASKTTFDFEPGVTAVVGPNGSGKSNVVDALSWVMGEQGAKTLRGGKMEDVIFAGTSGRRPLGRAQVTLTIDNADGALPIEYSEVTISRTLFRTGGSEYAINGAGCRLLDIQELLSDSGLGREMHVIVGQGQLDKILHATAEDRRGFIEEAAGILKHRRRKEKTVRKLESMQANLTRLTDLTAEIRRQLTPLGKQAAVARRARQVQFEAREARARLLADDFVQLTSSLEKEIADETALKIRRAGLERTLLDGRSCQTELERLAAEATPRLSAARETWYQLSATRERLRSLSDLAQERRRLLGAGDAPVNSGPDPEALARQAETVRGEQGELERQINDHRSAVETATEARAEAEEAAAAEEKRLAAILRAAADRREGLATLAGKVGAARSRVESAEAELGRLRQSIGAGAERRRQAQAEFIALESEVAGAEAGEATLDAEYERATSELDAVGAEIALLQDQEREAERERDALTARREALESGLQRKDGSRMLLGARIEGVLSPVTELLRIAAGYETAIAAALGPAAEAMTVTDLDAAVRALEMLKNDDGGQAALIVVDAADAAQRAAKDGTLPDEVLPDEVLPDEVLPDGVLPDGARWAVDLVEGTSGLDGAITALLGRVVVVDNLRVAGAVVSGRPELSAVTLAGDVFTGPLVSGGSSSVPSLLEVQAAVEETVGRLRTATVRAERAKFALANAAAQKNAAQADADAALERLHESDARLAAVVERLGHLGSTLRASAGETDRLDKLVAVAEANIVAEQRGRAEIAGRLAAAQQAPADADPGTDERDQLAAAAVAARRVETEARLALRTAEEQLTAISNRASALERAADAEREARTKAAERARRRLQQSRKAAAVGHAVQRVLSLIDVSLELAAAEREEAEQARAAKDAELAAIRRRNETAGAELAELTATVHRDELARAQQLGRIETLANRALDELGIGGDTLVAEYGPDLPVPAPTPDKVDKWAALGPADEPAATPYVRAEQEKRLKRAERDLAALGKVNPLALEEFAALEERHQFLAGQLDDLKSSRQDLLDIIREVDERVQQIFTSAYQDTAIQFERVFGRLFPGGEGRLVLTDPGDMLSTGIEVEARPAGKRIKRLSLLSGGERSLTAVALLVAIFKARPSPFYVMDEVEAALDETNLGRLIMVFEELRESSQLIIITHQKRTMEIADALYGVTMRGDGVTTVISQRLGATA